MDGHLKTFDVYRATKFLECKNIGSNVIAQREGEKIICFF